MEANEKQLEGWRRKTENLERKCEEAENLRRKVEQQLCEAHQENERLQGESKMLNTRVHDMVQREKDLVAQAAEQREREGVEELFTDELKEKMKLLESRNEILEHQITVE